MTLKCIAGIETPDSGVIRLNDKILYHSGERINLRPQERGVGYLFQDYALFPNMTVRQNILAGLHRLPRRERQQRAEELAEQFRVAHLLDQRPRRLSGGERQRAALARLFGSSPEVILLDEPFSSLDTVLKCELIPMMRDVIAAYGKSCLMVSHDVNELCALCTDVTAIKEGQNSPAVPAEDFAKQIRDRFSALNPPSTI